MGQEIYFSEAELSRSENINTRYYEIIFTLPKYRAGYFTDKLTLWISIHLLQIMK